MENYAKKHEKRPLLALARLIFPDFYRFFGLSWETSTLKNYHSEDSRHSGSLSTVVATERRGVGQALGAARTTSRPIAAQIRPEYRPTCLGMARRYSAQASTCRHAV